MYRLHIQAQWPLVFQTLAGVIAYLRCRDPLWYGLDVRTADGWSSIVHPNQSRIRVSEFEDPGVEDRT